jgi:hypothetical protein
MEGYFEKELMESYLIFGDKFEIYGVKEQLTPPDEFAYYDVYKNGKCLTSRAPLADIPSEDQIEQLFC